MAHSMKKYSHLVSIDEYENKMYIYRVYENGKKDLYTCIDFPEKSFNESKEGFYDFSRFVGEILLADSPEARNILGL